MKALEVTKQEAAFLHFATEIGGNAAAADPKSPRRGIVRSVDKLCAKLEEVLGEHPGYPTNDSEPWDGLDGETKHPLKLEDAHHKLLVEFFESLPEEKFRARKDAALSKTIRKIYLGAEDALKGAKEE